MKFIFKVTTAPRLRTITVAFLLAAKSTNNPVKVSTIHYIQMFSYFMNISTLFFSRKRGFCLHCLKLRPQFVADTLHFFDYVISVIISQYRIKTSRINCNSHLFFFPLRLIPQADLIIFLIYRDICSAVLPLSVHFKSVKIIMKISSVTFQNHYTILV